MSSSPATAEKLHLGSQVVVFQCVLTRLWGLCASRSVAELLPQLLPSTGKLLIWEHSAKSKGLCNLCSGTCHPLWIACVPATAAVRTTKIQLPPGRAFSFLGRTGTECSECG